jgi:hypothetical protein
VAISVAFSFVDTFPAVAVNVVEVAPAGIMTELDPVESSVLLVDSNTSMPPAGAAPFNVTVHVEDVWEFKLFGLQANWETEIIPMGAGRGLRGGTACPKATPESNNTSIPASATSVHLVNPRI